MKAFTIFQSAFHRGRGCYLLELYENEPIEESFSPLFIAVEVVTMKNPSISITTYGTFSPLFIAVEVVTQVEKSSRLDLRIFQSAFHRGRGCYSRCPVACQYASVVSFSPLFIAVEVVTFVLNRRPRHA